MEPQASHCLREVRRVAGAVGSGLALGRVLMVGVMVVVAIQRGALPAPPAL